MRSEVHKIINYCINIHCSERLSERSRKPSELIKQCTLNSHSFGMPGTFSKVFRKLVESYALYAVDWFEPEKEHKALRSEVTKFLHASLSARIETHQSVGLGTDCRLESKNITGFSLVQGDKIVHLSVFARRDQHNNEKDTSGMGRFTQRRRNRVY